jgi:hypothetical protein
MLILKRNFYIIFVVTFLFSTSTYATTPEIVSSSENQEKIQVTIYNSNLALVKDTRSVALNNGLNAVALRDVSAFIRSETALLKSVTSPSSLTLLEQNFDYDLISSQNLLEKHIGKTVFLIKTNPVTGIESSEEATILSNNIDGPILKIGNRIESGLGYKIAYRNLPDNLRDKPTLVTQILNNGPKKQTVELSYLTGGLSWKADYVAELNAKEDTVNISSLVTLVNNSGASYKNASLQLVAGDVNLVSERMRTYMPMPSTRKSEAVMDMAAPEMHEESLLEYHLYSLNRPTTLANNQTKQVALLSANNLPVKKQLILRGFDYYYQSQYGEIGTKLKPAVYISFTNSKAQNLGIPLPKGVVRVYKNDLNGNAQFIGEDAIDHTAKNETVKLKLGDSFDVTADKKQTDFKIVSSTKNGIKTYESAFEINLKNAKNEKVTVTIQEPIGGDWKIISENNPHVKSNSTLATWEIEVPAEGNTSLQYRVQVKY